MTSPFTLPEIVAEGHRNDTLYRLARTLKARHLTPEAIVAAVRVENEARCRPPLPDTEILDIVNGALRQADRAGFVGNSYDTAALVPDPETEPLEADAVDDPEAARLSEAELAAKLNAVRYEDLVIPATDVFMANWYVRWWGHELRVSPQEPYARWWNGTYWAEDTARGRMWQRALLTVRLLHHAGRMVPIPAEVLTAAVTRLIKRYNKRQEEAPNLTIPNAEVTTSLKTRKNLRSRREGRRPSYAGRD